MRALISGGAGFIGSHVADALLSEGHAVAVLDDLSTGRRAFVPGAAEFLEADIASAQAADFLARWQPEVLVHHAARVSVRDSVKDPVEDARVNVLGTLALFEACRRAGTRRVLFASTGGAMYGRTQRFPTPESEPPTPLSPYGCAKLAAEAYLDFYAHVHGFSCCALRYANVYGPRQSPHGEAGVVSIFADRFLRGEPPTIHGDGSQTRDYVHVRDVAAAVLRVLSSFTGEGAGEQEAVGRFNVGTGVETSVTDLAEALRAASGASVRPRHGPERPGDAPRSSLDAGALRQATGWAPRVSLQEGLRDVLAWCRTEARA